MIFAAGLLRPSAKFIGTLNFFVLDVEWSEEKFCHDLFWLRDLNEFSGQLSGYVVPANPIGVFIWTLIFILIFFF